MNPDDSPRIRGLGASQERKGKGTCIIFFNASFTQYIGAYIKCCDTEANIQKITK